jgi:ABC-2 type transport system permease protein
VSILGAEGGNTQALITLLRANLGGDVQLAQRIGEPLDLRTEVVGAAPEQQAGDDGSPFASLGIGFAAALLLAFAIINGGSWLVQAVAEEKENRTVEVVLTSVQPTQLMAGKLLGLGVVALVQLAIWFVLSGGALGAAVAVGVSLAAGVSLGLLLWAVLFFVLGFAFYGALMTAFGALGATVRESSQIAGFMTIPMLIPLYFFFFGVFEDQPNGIAAQVLSYLPFTAPVTMVLRLGAGVVPLWQILLSIVLLVLSVAGAIWLAARVFRASTLLTGTKPTLRSLLRVARSA